ncbi:hypothetical protein TNCV_4910211 [Trichonephila clavipes]|nr:hypothetical protein TNCV_4910211 [Trichonephila clavipes]
MESNICNSMILTSRRRHFYLVGQSKHKVGACGVNNQASAVLAGNELPFVAFSEKETPNSTTLSKKIAQGNLTASCKRLISWFLLYKGTELGRKIVPVRPVKF